MRLNIGDNWRWKACSGCSMKRKTPSLWRRKLNIWRRCSSLDTKQKPSRRSSIGKQGRYPMWKVMLHDEDQSYTPVWDWPKCKEAKEGGTELKDCCWCNPNKATHNKRTCECSPPKGILLEFSIPLCAIIHSFQTVSIKTTLSSPAFPCYANPICRW